MPVDFLGLMQEIGLILETDEAGCGQLCLDHSPYLQIVQAFIEASAHSQSM
jgi:hypothetical protein